MKIHEQMIAILRDVETIKKEKKNAQQGYSFRGIDDMYNELHPIFKKHGVYILSNVISSERNEKTTRNGGIVIYTICKVMFKFMAEDGSYVETLIEGEAMDSGDKSTNKALSSALKYSLMQTFLIPTTEKLDTEYETHEVVKSKQLHKRHEESFVNRINAGEVDLIEKILGHYDLTEEQKNTFLRFKNNADATN